MVGNAIPDRRALFEETVSTNMDALYSTSLRLTRNREDAEDLVAEAVAKAWAELDSLRDANQIRAWIFRILTNSFISQFRTRQRAPDTVHYDESQGDEEEKFSLFEKLHQPFLLWWNNPEQEFINKLLRNDISNAIDQLPEEFRTIVVLVDVQGFSYQEAAEIVGIPVGTVRSRVKRARGRLQRALWEQARDAGLNLTNRQKTEWQ